uniref:Putative E3 ubiquitin-protein ligase LIN-1 n=1 Tax=Anthurium amnicola TaxID=1678845 RepID=A0A1D1YLZ1_9ARAE
MGHKLMQGKVCHPHYPPESKEGESSIAPKASISNVVRKDNGMEAEDGMNLFIKLDYSAYNENKEIFDIKRLQEMLEDSQSETSVSFYSQIDSTEGSDSEVKMHKQESPPEVLPPNADFTSASRNMPSSLSGSSTKTCPYEAPRYPMHVESYGLKSGYLVSSESLGSVSDLSLSVLDIRDAGMCPSYKCYLEYSTSPSSSPAREFRCFGHFQSKLLRRYHFPESVHRGSFARKKLNFSNVGKDWIVGQSTYENDNCIEFLGRFEKAVSTLCFSEGLGKCEDAGIEVTSVWEMLTNKQEAKYSTLKQEILHQLLDIISTSKEEKVVKTSVYILLVLVSEDKSIIDDIRRKELHLYCLARALKTNIQEAVILIYLLKPSPSQIKDLELLPALVEVACNPNLSYQEASISLPLSPTAASIAIIEILVTAFDYVTNNMHLAAISSPQILSKLVNVARNKNLEEGVALAAILVRCIRLSGNCRKFLSQVTPVDPFLHLLKSSELRAKYAALEYFHEILRMPRSSAIVLLHQIRQLGNINIMHTLMACIQQAHLEHKLLAANLLLQLDMLEDSLGKSIFKEEAMEVLLEAIASEETPSTQILSGFILSNLGGTYAWTGEPYTAAWLVKKAGLISNYHRNIIKNVDFCDPCLQEVEMDAWSSKTARSVIKFGSSVFNALAKGIQSKTRSVSRDCLIASTWLGCEMAVMGTSNLRYSACEILLDGVVNFLPPGFELDERVLACQCVYNYASGKGMQKLMKFSEGLRESFRRLSGVTWMAEELLRVTDYFLPAKPQRVSCVHSQILEASSHVSGAATALIFYKGQLFSGYSDGSIKVWDIKGQTMKLLLEVREHKKAVTCFTLSDPGNKLMSGSADKTVRVWQMVQRKLECVEIIDIKEPVQKLGSSGDKVFVVTQGRGLKVCQSSRIIQTFCKNKHVRCLGISQGKLYVGCTDSSIQEVDILHGQKQEIRPPTNCWRMHNRPINSIIFCKGWVYHAGSTIEGSRFKEWRRRNKPEVTIGMAKGTNVLDMAVVEDFVYLSCSSTPSILQIWLRGQQRKVGRLSAGSKIVSLLTGNDIVLCGTENGLIKGWIPL